MSPHKNFSAGHSLFDGLRDLLRFDDIVRSVEHLGGLHRYTGSEQGEAAADFILTRLREHGVDAVRHRYDAFVSRPLRSFLSVNGVECPCIAAVYSAEADRLTGPLYFDAGDEGEKNWQSSEKRFAAMKNRIVLTGSAGGEFALRAGAAGALAVVCMQDSGENMIHHSTLGTVWGTPAAADFGAFPDLPCVCVTRASGEAMREQAKQGKNDAVLSVSMEQGVKNSSMPVAFVPGKSEKFVLISGHYDGWYEGITDNAVANAIMIELARVFAARRNDLERGVMLAWWSGHSDGRYAGSTWFCDNFRESLDKNCIAHINIDLAGCKNAEQIRARTTLMEGFDFTAKLIEKYTGQRAKPHIPMIRGADQSFWGTRIPVSVMLKYEPLDEKRDFSCPSGGPWWHTDQDTIDKMDRAILERDTLINAEMACLLANCVRIPAEVPEFVDRTVQMLRDLEKDLGEDFPLREVFERFAALKEVLRKTSPSRIFTDDSVKAVAGELTRLGWSECSRYAHDRAVSMQPFNFARQAANAAKNPERYRPERYLAVKTDFVRQKNRLVGELDGLVAMVGSLEGNRSPC